MDASILHPMISALNGVETHSPLGKILRFFLNFIPKTHVTRVRGGVNKGRRWVVGSSIHRCWLGSYEADKQALLEQWVKPGMTVWDVGANAGFYSLAFSRITGPQGRVYSFEPLGANMENLLEHMRLNELQNTVAVQSALGSGTFLCSFDTGISHQKGFLTEKQTGYMVPCTSGDEFLATYPESRPALLKIDIEGAESGMLEGARTLLTRDHPVLLLALHGDDQREKCFRLLKEFGYHIQDLSGATVTTPAGCGEEILAIPVPVSAPIPVAPQPLSTVSA